MHIQSSTEEDATLPAAVCMGYLCGYGPSIHITAGLNPRAIMTTATAAKSIRAQERSPTSASGRQFEPKRSASSVNYFTRGSCKCRVLRGPSLFRRHGKVGQENLSDVAAGRSARDNRRSQTKRYPMSKKRPVYLRADPQGCIYFLRV